MTVWRSQNREHLRALGKKYRAANREKDQIRVAAFTARNVAIINAAKSAPCEDCGRSFPPIAMDLHHLRDKERGIAQMRNAGEKRLRAEIAKCVALCAVCHRLRHG